MSTVTLTADERTIALSPVFVAGPARAESFDTEAELLAATRNNGALAYAVDTTARWAMEGGEWVEASVPDPVSLPYYGKIAGAYGNGDPGALLALMQRAGNVSPSRTDITTSIARCSMFCLPFALTVNRYRAFGLGATGIYVGLYRYSDLARLDTQSWTLSNGAWSSIATSAPVILAADTLYFVAVSVPATGGSTAAAMGASPSSAAVGQIATAPDALPGNMAASAGYINGYQFQFAVTAGVLPDPANTLAAQGAWVGGMPAIFLDNNDAA